MSQVKLDFMFPYVHNPKTEVLPHQHNCYELVYYYEGMGKSDLNSGTVNFSANTFSIYTPKMQHNEYHFEKTSVFCIGFFLLNSTINIRSGNYADNDHIVQFLIEKIKQEAVLKQIHYRDVINIHLSEIIYRIDRMVNEKQYTYDEFYIIKKYIEENLDYSIDIDILSKMSGYSYHYFRHKFKEQTKISPKQYILNRRIEYAQNLLLNSPISITNIAQICGFNCSSQFNSAFKKRIKMTPTEYRRTYKNMEIKSHNID